MRVPGKINRYWLAVVLVMAGVICWQVFFVKKPPQRPVPVKPPVKVAKPREVVGRIAVVLDDWGYNRTHCRYLSGFGAPVAVAVIPDLPYSRDVLQCAKAAGQEAMLHLPVEPHKAGENYSRGQMLTTSMSQREALKFLRSALDGLPGIVGVNNHEGSKGTEDRSLMITVLRELKRRGLFFVDSVTSGKSVCAEVARQIGVPFARREVFLDNRNERAAIERQFAQAARLAKEKGQVLIIGHDRVLTLQILTEQIRKLKAQGYLFVTVKDFIRGSR